MRQAKLAELLATDGHSVSTFAIDKIRLEGSVVQKTLIREAVDDAACVVMPLPVTSREGMLNAPLSGGLYTTREVLSALRPEQVLCAGRIDEATRELAGSMGITLIDYLEREELAVANAVAAAEGAIQLIMEETPITVCHSNCLVIGFGRIGKILSHRLRGLGAHVTATARSWADLAWIKAYGYEAEETYNIDASLSRYDVVINTVPARVLGESRLMKLRRGCLCLDLASKPGGLDFTAASKLGVKAVWALSLPGEVAPVTSGAIIRDTIYNILNEKGIAL
ncbi:dipicolinate synthase subunit A [Sporobacter termitidis DSM 10068]|uniref:Dipicolinate synthase subunit A n=2 Tax=Sporobacter TaxID=44748 RepID=A0A1M5Z505_9FIRM|nr:dipicolinate synthase subunit A [Sporobacter termitidis DSM 10068]